MWPRAGQRFEVWQSIEREIYFARRSAELVTLDIIDEVLRQMIFAHHLHERETWIDTGRDYVSVKLIAVFQHDAFRFAFLQNDFCDGRFGANLVCRLLLEKKKKKKIIIVNIRKRTITYTTQIKWTTF